MHFSDPAESATQVMRLSPSRDAEERFVQAAIMKGQGWLWWHVLSSRPPYVSFQLGFLRA